MWDAPLTAQGVEQARNAAADFQGQPSVGVALVSPLTRAVSTCLLALPPASSKAAKRYEVCPLLAEHLEASCDIGRTPNELSMEFPELSFVNLPEVWWYFPEDHATDVTPAKSRTLFSEYGRREPVSAFRARVDAFAQLLTTRVEGTIAAFGHADFFHEFLHRYFCCREQYFNDYWMKNCEVLALRITSAADLQPPSPLVEEASTAEAEKPPAEPVAKPAGGAAARGLAILKSEIKAQQPELKPAELRKALVQRWKGLTQQERADYMMKV